MRLQIKVFPAYIVPTLQSSEPIFDFVVIALISLLGGGTCFDLFQSRCLPRQILLRTVNYISEFTVVFFKFHCCTLRKGLNLFLFVFSFFNKIVYILRIKLWCNCGTILQLHLIIGSNCTHVL